MDSAIHNRENGSLFLEKYRDWYALQGDHQVMTLATGVENRITARAMSVILFDGKFYFQTDRDFDKFRQIQENPQIALSYGNVSLEGICHDIGHPLEERNRFFAERYQAAFSSAYKRYSHRPNNVLIEVEPRRMTLWCYEGWQPYREYFDFLQKSWSKEYYQLV